MEGLFGGWDFYAQKLPQEAANKSIETGENIMRQSNLFAGILLGIGLAVAGGVFSPAAEARAESNVIIAYEQNHTGPGAGWKQSEDGSWCYQRLGEMLKSCTETIDGHVYIFDENGRMLTGWQTIDGAQYYFTENADASHPYGSRYTAEKTPDGNEVDGDGKLIAQAASGAKANPYGNVNCIEVDLGNQMVYAYNGLQCVLASQCVTGRVVNGNATPTGNYRVYNKERNRTLRGYNSDGSKYASFVSFWMPFNGAIGLHDATWRTNFNADVYYNYGSHGCINMPYDFAAALYNIVYVGMPVYVHG